MFARVVNLIPGELTYYVNDLHIYSNHMNALASMPVQSYSKPSVKVARLNSMFDYTMDNFELMNYKAGAKIKLDMAV